MNNRIIIYFCVILLYSVRLCWSQNLDLGLVPADSYLPGLARPNDPGAFDDNPALLSAVDQFALAMRQDIVHYKYELIRNTSFVGTGQNKWGKNRLEFSNIRLGFPVNQKWSIGGGYIQRIRPYLNNRQIAPTFSTLFTQETKGAIQSGFLTAAYQITPKLSMGLNLFYNFGMINSRISGENHDQDVGKWAEMKNEFSGFNYSLGSLFEHKLFNLALAIELPVNLDVTTTTKLSADQLYDFLLPTSQPDSWELPLRISGGIAFRGLKNWTFLADFERRFYSKTDFQFNLFEFGQGPVWKDISVFRGGVEFYPFLSKRIPLRIGYTHEPQLYASNELVTVDQEIYDSRDLKQTVKQNFAFGTAFQLPKIDLNLEIDYSWLNWERKWYLSGVIITDEFTEKRYTVSIEAVYRKNTVKGTRKSRRFH